MASKHERHQAATSLNVREYGRRRLAFYIAIDFVNVMGKRIGSITSKLPASAVAVAMLAITPAAVSHHSRAMFDMAKNITYRGIVKEYRWQDPHSHIVVVVGPEAADQSTVGTWTIEASAISLMTTRGWTRTTYKPGDTIAVVAHPNFDGSDLVLLFYAIRPDGTRLYRARNRYPLEKE